MFLAILKIYWKICLFKKGPQDSPYSKIIAWMGALALIALLLLQLKIADLEQALSIGSMVIRAVALVAGIGIYTAGVLWLTGFSNRILQAVSSLFFTQIIVHSFAFPLILFAPDAGAEQLGQARFAFIAMIYLVFVIFLNVWQLMINSYIYQQALSKRFGVGLLVSFGLLAFNLLLINLV